MRPIRRSHLQQLGLSQRVAYSQQQVVQLRQENQHLKALLMATASAHSLDAEILALKRQIQYQKTRYQQELEGLRKSLAQMTQEKEDLEAILQTLTEHSDAVDAHWQEKLDDAVSLASIDGLTQVANRRRFDDQLAKQWQKLSQERGHLSILLCDIDYFKRYNDCYGHLAGDACLTQVAQAIAKTVRAPHDVVARYGGEEFAVILPNTPAQGAIAAANRVQKAIAQLQIPHAGSGVGPFVSLSIGVAHTIPTDQQTWTDLIEIADKALYQSKAKGRNQCSLAVT